MASNEVSLTGSAHSRIANVPLDLLRHELLMTLQPVPEETITEIVDEIFLPLDAKNGLTAPFRVAAARAPEPSQGRCLQTGRTTPTKFHVPELGRRKHGTPRYVP